MAAFHPTGGNHGTTNYSTTQHSTARVPRGMHGKDPFGIPVLHSVKKQPYRYTRMSRFYGLLEVENDA